MATPIRQQPPRSFATPNSLQQSWSRGRGTHQPVLLLDAAPFHLQALVLQMLRAKKQMQRATPPAP
eukprot:8810039-Prorocentrum_lima.AAC.1